ncbi:helix-turn-helix transcriptional regulator [Zhengella sp. ZM62]|uniref:helix-turn-helix transcriptional regulator n=1 Tax=Zhengella sedimenti TaxID=3390035 RepID=UPI0039753B2D
MKASIIDPLAAMNTHPALSNWLELENLPHSPPAWTAVLEGLCCRVGAIGSALLSEDVGRRIRNSLVSERFLPVAEAYFAEKWHQSDIRDRAWRVLKQTGVAVDDDFSTPEERDSNPYYAFVRRHGLEHFMALRLATRSGDWAVCLYFRSAEDLEACRNGQAEALRQSLQRAVEDAQAVADTSVLGMCDAARQLGLDYAVVDGSGSVAGEISGEETILARLPEHMRCQDPDASCEKGAAMLSWSDLEQGLSNPVILRENDGTSIHLGFMPAPEPARHVFEPPRLLAMWRRYCPRELDPGDEAFITRYGLTPAEARIAHAIADGRLIHEIARMSGHSEGTVRQQLKSIYRKTESSSQHQLAALVWRSRC